jgi:hypothetical protein
MVTARVALSLLARPSLSRAFTASGAVGRFGRMSSTTKVSEPFSALSTVVLMLTSLVFYFFLFKRSPKWEPAPHLVPTKEDWEDEASRREELKLQAKKRARGLAESAEEESHHPDYENHSIPMQDVDTEMELQAKAKAQRLAESAEAVDKIPDEHYFSAVEEQEAIALESQPRKERKPLVIPHVTFPVNYPTVEYIESIAKAKAEDKQGVAAKAAAKEKEDEIRHHAWE